MAARTRLNRRLNNRRRSNKDRRLNREQVDSVVSFNAGVVFGASIERARPRQQPQITETATSTRPDSVQPTGALTPNPWPRLIGKYRNDPSWEQFDDFLITHRQEVDRLFAESEQEAV